MEEQDPRTAVQVELETMARIADPVEDFALARSISDAQDEAALGPEAARKYYRSLDKAP